MGKFGAVFSYHFLEGIKKKSTFITMAIFFALTLGMFAFMHFSSGGEEEKEDFVFINTTTNYAVDTEGLNQAVPSAAFKDGKASDLESLKDKVKEDELDGVIVLEEGSGTPVLTYVYNNLPDREIMTLTNVYVQQQFINTTVKENNVAPEVAAKLFSQVEMKEEAIADKSSTLGLANVFMILMYIFLLTFAPGIATMVAAEKSSRVMEVLIPKVKPIYMMYGKILAMLSLSILQFSVIGIAIGVAMGLGWLDPDNLSLFGGAIDFSSVTPLVLVAFIAYFILGYWLFAILYAALGSLVSRTEDLPTAVMPATMLILAAFFIGMSTLGDPNSTMAVISSYVPFLSPLAGLSRVVMGEMSAYDMSISLGILFVTIIIINIFVNRIYVNAVMNYSEKWQWKNLVRFMKKN
ncbi:ABC transporter permease [Priestia taiwanensis]|uniref:Sodium export permease n=1 Tax=Priestia taiwanensis TaxID=1347902 RepID=A0A917ER03_9BACI|nr:ABC transporter permease [Priestia taiwanensis]MBM7363369.1 ABC-2 type transport system permease protein [Priestia taiwanensis]GGE77723.1 sodium export permease [Priestia taiwanensis]